MAPAAACSSSIPGSMLFFVCVFRIAFPRKVFTSFARRLLLKAFFVAVTVSNSGCWFFAVLNALLLWNAKRHTGTSPCLPSPTPVLAWSVTDRWEVIFLAFSCHRKWDWGWLLTGQQLALLSTCSVSGISRFLCPESRRENGRPGTLCVCVCVVGKTFARNEEGGMSFNLVSFPFFIITVC